MERYHLSSLTMRPRPSYQRIDDLDATAAEAAQHLLDHHPVHLHFKPSPGIGITAIQEALNNVDVRNITLDGDKLHVCFLPPRYRELGEPLVAVVRRLRVAGVTVEILYSETTVESGDDGGDD